MQFGEQIKRFVGRNKSPKTEKPSKSVSKIHKYSNDDLKFKRGHSGLKKRESEEGINKSHTYILSIDKENKEGSIKRPISTVETMNRKPFAEINYRSNRENIRYELPIENREIMVGNGGNNRYSKLSTSTMGAADIGEETTTN
jgi:hypothetical protein